MEYKRIDENTIRCIVTEEDMENFGLNLDEFLSHSGRSDEFLQYIVSEARDELGYENDKGIVSMRLEVLSDRRISITFGNGNEKQVREQVLKYLKELAESHILQEIGRMGIGRRTRPRHSRSRFRRKVCRGKPESRRNGKSFSVCTVLLRCGMSCLFVVQWA